jgi:hypothetical protein
MISGAYPDLEDTLCRAPHHLATSFDKGIEILSMVWMTQINPSLYIIADKMRYTAQYLTSMD